MKFKTIGMSLLIGGTLLSGGWMYGSKMIRTSLQERIDFHREKSGAQIHYDSLEIKGFPFVFHVKLQSPSVEIMHGKSHPLFLKWQGDELQFRITPWSWKELKGKLIGSHTFSLSLGKELSPLLEGTIKDGRVIASLTHRGLLSEGSLMGDEVTVKGRSAAYPLRIQKGRLTLYRGTQVSDGKRRFMWGLKFFGDKLFLPLEPSFPLGSIIDNLILEGFVLKPSVPLLDWADFLNAWREEEGALEITLLNMVWGPMSLSLNGTLSVDQDLRPMGSMTTSLAGYAQTLDALVQKGVMKKREAKIGKIALDILARQENDQPSTIVSLPVTAQDGKLTVGPLVFMPVPSVLDIIESQKTS